MDNLAFVRSLAIPPDAQQRCLDAMAKYGDDHWWEPDVDPRYFAYRQINEPILLCRRFSQFHEAFELLVGRPVWTHEFGINVDGLKQEAERAWRWQTGPMTEREQTDATIRSMDMLRTWAKEHGKQIIEINLPESEVGNA